MSFSSAFANIVQQSAITEINNLFAFIVYRFLVISLFIFDVSCLIDYHFFPLVDINALSKWFPVQLPTINRVPLLTCDL